MSDMTPAAEQWSYYSAAQNLPAVLNNPNMGKQSNFFIRTWGDAFVEKNVSEKSPFLPDINYSHFDTYLMHFGKRLKRHKRLSQNKSEVNTQKKIDVDSSIDLKEIPNVFLKQDFHLNNSGVFTAVFQKQDKKGSVEVIEELSRYLDIVEMQIAKHVSQKSDAFFHAMTSHDTIMEQMKTTCNEVHNLRCKLHSVDKLLARKPLYLIGLKKSLVNHLAVNNKLKFMSTVLQTQPTLQLLLSSSDYVGALELIASTQKVLGNELAGVTSLRHLPSQLREMLKLIDKMLHTEFERYAAADLHRPLNNDKAILESDHLISLVSGLLRQNHLQFLEIYKQESITAAQALLKQFMIEALADVEDDEEQCLRGSGEVTLAMDATHWMKALSLASEALGSTCFGIPVNPFTSTTVSLNSSYITAAQALLKQFMIEALADVEDDEEQCLRGSGEVTLAMDATHWMKALSLASEALEKLLSRVSAVLEIIKQTAEASAGLIPASELNGYKPDKFLTSEQHSIVQKKLHELLVSVCDYCNERLASIVGTQTDKQILSSTQIMELSKTIDSFSRFCEIMCGKQSPALRAAFKIQAGNYVNKFHLQRKNKLTMLLDAERWKVADIPYEFQTLVDRLSSNDIMKSLPNSPTDDCVVSNDKKVMSALSIDAHNYVTAGTVLILIRIVSEYCVCAYELSLLAPVLGKDLAEVLRVFNSRSCQLVLGAGALKTAGLKTITSTNLALTSRSLQLVLWMIPHIRTHFNQLTNDPLIVFNSVEKDISNHIQQLETKVLSIMSALLGDQLNEWEAKPPVPSKAFRNISRHIIKLHEAVNYVLPNDQVTYIYEIVHKNFKTSLHEHLVRLNIQNNGGPQHGLVTAEITFYLQTMTMLNVLPEKLLSNKYMDDIW